jgi:hypothetical protein
MDHIHGIRTQASGMGLSLPAASKRSSIPWTASENWIPVRGLAVDHQRTPTPTSPGLMEVGTRIFWRLHNPTTVPLPRHSVQLNFATPPSPTSLQGAIFVLSKNTMSHTCFFILPPTRSAIHGVCIKFESLT